MRQPRKHIYTRPDARLAACQLIDEPGVAPDVGARDDEVGAWQVGVAGGKEEWGAERGGYVWFVEVLRWD
jgi:hypothetical protein